VPENTLKYVVGLMLSSFGVFWTGEGLGAEWPGADLALIGIFVIFAIAAWLFGRQAKAGRTALTGGTN